jgi:hypothetical protein
MKAIRRVQIASAAVLNQISFGVACNREQSSHDRNHGDAP